MDRLTRPENRISTYLSHLTVMEPLSSTNIREQIVVLFLNTYLPRNYLVRVFNLRGTQNLILTIRKIQINMFPHLLTHPLSRNKNQSRCIFCFSTLGIRTRHRNRNTPADDTEECRIAQERRLPRLGDLEALPSLARKTRREQHETTSSGLLIACPQGEPKMVYQKEEDKQRKVSRRRYKEGVEGITRKRKHGERNKDVKKMER